MIVALKKNDGVGFGNKSIVYKASPTIVVKTVHDQSKAEDPFREEINFYTSLDKRQDQCPHIVQCFLALPHYLFLSYCDLNRIDLRFVGNQEGEERPGGFTGRLIRVNNHEDSALIARWLQQVTSALEHVEKMGFCHNDIHPRNCLLDQNHNLKLCDFDRTTTIGQFLEGVLAPWARELVAGPLKGSYGLCCARTEQFAVGTLLYFMVYGHEPYEDINLAQNPAELSRRFGHMEFPELNRHEVFDEFISTCWHNVYPTMGFVAYDLKRKTKDIASGAECEVINYTKERKAEERKACEALIQRGLLGPDLAFRFQRVWKRYLHVITGKAMFIWQSVVNLLWTFR